MTRENATYYRDYEDIAEDMIDDLSRGILPHVGTLQYMYGMSEAGRSHAERVMDRILENPQLADQFDIAAIDFEAELVH